MVVTLSNVINIQVLAESAITRDQANGTYAAKIASDDKYYHWHGTQQTIPVGMDNDPEGFAAGLRRAMPLVDTLRLPFNLASFNADGSLHDQYERFLTAAAQQGFKIVFVQTEGLAQRSGSGAGWTADSLATHLDQTVIPRMEAAWAKMADWLNDHTAVKAAVTGYELANEPAAWARGEVLAATGVKQATLDRFVALYADHMERLAAATGADANDKILIGGWGYSGSFEELARPVINGTSALDHLESVLGNQLVWSAHLYPGWHGTDRLDPAGIIARLEQVYAPMAGRQVLLTEFNLTGASVNDTTETGNIAFLFGRMQEWFADKGFGMGWFPGAEAGGSSLVTIDAGGGLRFLHQHSYAMAMNAFTLDDQHSGLKGNDLLNANLIAGKLRNETTDADYNPAAPFDPVQGFGLAVGYAGNDTLVGRGNANNLLYGGTGGDLLVGHTAEDFLFGQAGADMLVGDAGRDFLYGGRGNDTLYGNAGNDVLEGGAGADLFVADAGSDVLVDFSAAQGDLVSFGTRYQSFSQISQRMTLVAHDAGPANDIRISHADGTSTIILNAAGTLTAAQVRLPGQIGVIDAHGATRIAPGFVDIDGEMFGTDSFRVVGSAAKEQIFGTASGDTLQGEGGNDMLDGRDGNDVLIGGAGADSMFGGNGADSFYFEGLGDVAFGGAGNDRFYTGKEAATMSGGDGNDLFVIRAGTRGHVVTGNAGIDQFDFFTAKGGSGARIIDFDAGVDRLTIDGALVNLAAPPAGVTLTETATGTHLAYGSAGLIVLDGLFL